MDESLGAGLFMAYQFLTLEFEGRETARAASDESWMREGSFRELTHTEPRNYEA